MLSTILLLVSAIHYSSAEYCTFGFNAYDCNYGCCTDSCCLIRSTVKIFDSTREASLYIYYIVGGVIGGLVLLGILITLCCCVAANNSSRRGRVVAMPMNQPQIVTVSSSQMNSQMYPHGSQPQYGPVPGQYYPPPQYNSAPGQYNPPPGPPAFNLPNQPQETASTSPHPPPGPPTDNLPNQPQETASTSPHPPPETLNQAERIPEKNPFAQAAGTTS